MALREAFDVCFVDHRVWPGMIRPAVIFPIEALVDDHALWDREGVIAVVDLEIRSRSIRVVGEHRRRVVANTTVDCFRVGVDEELRGIESVPGLGLVGPIDPVGVALPWSGTGKVAVPVERGALFELYAGLVILAVEKTELDTFGVFGKE